MDANETLPRQAALVVAKSSIFHLVIAMLIAAFVFILNPLTIVAIVRTPSLRRCHSNIFLLNLAVVDLLIMALVISFITCHWLGSHHHKVLCLLGVIALGTVALTSMLFCFAIAVDRFLFIHKAMTYSGIVTYARVLKVVASVWILSVLIGCIPLMGGDNFLQNCDVHMSVGVSIQGTIVFMLFCLTGVISVCLYTKIFFIIRDHNKVLETHTMVQCRAHGCSSHACKVTTRLGECRFRHDSLSSAFTWRAGSGRTSDDHMENKHSILRATPSASSVTSGSNASNSLLRFQDGDLNVVVANTSSNPTSERIYRVQSQTLVERGNDIMHLSEERDLRHEIMKGASPVVVSRGTKKSNKFGKCQHLRDLRTIKTLMMMFAIYFICWSPLVALKLRHFLFRQQISDIWMGAAWISAVSNSMWNFMVYPLRKKELRDAILKMLSRCLRLQTDHGRPRSLLKDGENKSTHSSLKKSSSCASRLY